MNFCFVVTETIPPHSPQWIIPVNAYSWRSFGRGLFYRTLKSDDNFRRYPGVPTLVPTLESEFGIYAKRLTDEQSAAFIAKRGYWGICQ